MRSVSEPEFTAARSMPDLDPVAIVRVLNKHGVRFVIIGGIAALINDLPVPATVDIDLTPARDRKNLERLALAFDELEAGLLTAEPGGSWFPRIPVENWAQYDSLHLMTTYGPLDIVFTPDGVALGYEDLAKSAERRLLGDEPALVITAATWEALKQASGRAKDLAHLDMYYEARDDR
jgi:hypothetical protein